MSLELHLFLLLLSCLSNGLLKSSELKKPIPAPNGMARSSPENPTGFSTDNGLQGVFGDIECLGVFGQNGMEFGICFAVSWS